MAIKRPNPEEIVLKLHRVKVLMGQRMPRIDPIRQIGVTEQTCYRWKKKQSEFPLTALGVERSCLFWAERVTSLRRDPT